MLDSTKIKTKFMCLKLETTGLIGRNSIGGLASYKNLKEYDNARLICLHYAIFDKQTYTNEYENRLLINPDNCYISDEINQIHHISQEDIHNEGKKSEEALMTFLNDMEKVQELVIYNKKFYNNIIKSELYRLDKEKLVKKYQKCKIICLAELCKKHFLYRIYKFQEAYEKLLKKEMNTMNYLENMKEMIMEIRKKNEIFE